MGLESLYARRGLKGLSRSSSESSRSWINRARAQGVMMAMPRRWASRLPRVLAILAPGLPARNGSFGAGKNGGDRGTEHRGLEDESRVARCGVRVRWNLVGRGMDGWRQRL